MRFARWLFVLAVMACFPAVALAQSATGGLLSGLSGQLQGAALVVLLGLALKLLPRAWAAFKAWWTSSGEKKVDAAVDASPLGKHAAADSATKLLLHHLGLLFLVTGDKVVADASAEGKLDAALAAKVKTDILTKLQSVLSVEMVYACARELGFIYSNKDATVAAVMAYAGNQVDAIIQGKVAQATPAPLAAPAKLPAGPDVPAANPPKAPAAV